MYICILLSLFVILFVYWCVSVCERECVCVCVFVLTKYVYICVWYESTSDCFVTLITFFVCLFVHCLCCFIYFCYTMAVFFSLWMEFFSGINKIIDLFPFQTIVPHQHCSFSISTFHANISEWNQHFNTHILQFFPVLSLYW